MRYNSFLVIHFTLFTFLLSIAPASLASAGVIAWTDWQSGSNTNGFTGLGQITTATALVDVTYNNPNGIAFFQSGAGTDFFANGGGGRNAATSPFTSSLVENIPTAAEMIALQFQGTQTLTFSQAIANPVFSYISLNGNGYAFDQDFDILSFGGSTSPEGARDSGYWGAGTSYKSIVALGGGAFEYQLLGTGEPHGTIRFKGAFNSVSWRSLSNENWNGFTVGIQGTAQEVFATVPEPASVATWTLLSLALSVFQFRRARKS
ncbi:MAG: hypothetical protein SFV81_04705 [Pirellulaceae bacterium]|nr:hypothetical protein [Pirellulaceae bacterium]